MTDKYPNPCLSCRAKCNNGGCEAWRIRYLYRQKQINAFYRKLTTGEATYRPPVPKYPCKGCEEAQNCDIPCRAYLHWYNVKMTQIRRRCGLCK